jgi:hypothetical protein
LKKYRKYHTRIRDNEIPLGDQTDVVGPLRAHAYKVTAGALLRERQRRAFDESRKQKAAPTPAQKWLLENWSARDGEKTFFVTDHEVVLIRNFHYPYIVDLAGSGAERSQRYFCLRRNIPVFLITPFNAESLRAATSKVSQLCEKTH